MADRRLGRGVNGFFVFRSVSEGPGCENETLEILVKAAMTRAYKFWNNSDNPEGLSIPQNKDHSESRGAETVFHT